MVSHNPALDEVLLYYTPLPILVALPLVGKSQRSTCHFIEFLSMSPVSSLNTTIEYEDLQDFIECYNAENSFARQESARFRAFTYAN